MSDEARAAQQLAAISAGLVGLFEDYCRAQHHQTWQTFWWHTGCAFRSGATVHSVNVCTSQIKKTSAKQPNIRRNYE